MSVKYNQKSIDTALENFRIIVEKTPTGYSAYCNDVVGVVSTGRSWDEVKDNFKEAFQFHLEGLDEDEVSVAYQLEFSLDVGQFFE